MSFLYPRTIDLRRPQAQPGKGALGYGGQTAATDAPVAQAICCSIQERREGQKANPGLPGDGTKPTWYVFIPRNGLAKGLVKDRDILVDDEGARYQVLANYWDSLGYRLTAERLEA